MFDTKNNFVFSLYGTLVDIHTDENLPYLWSSMARYYSMKGASYDEAEFREEYSRLCREQAEASAKKSKKGKSKLDPDEAEIWAPFDHLKYARSEQEAAKRLKCSDNYLRDSSDFYSHNDEDYPIDWAIGDFS